MRKFIVVFLSLLMMIFASLVVLAGPTAPIEVSPASGPTAPIEAGITGGPTAPIEVGLLGGPTAPIEV